ncbi:UDP-glycosyltransferase 85A1 isoform X2 [Cryptomeria japonica]|uniref:UDP-glycosyltransferase 85A1 isoform X2 n=1 Tax=Cryptomeria japonica TaxID=3369 RepID=UPI0027DA66CD|nr:UDP-glycosyltransferase 85A1 isoform X2 [Cryptomeria japonica]XP_059065711.1 UDP-glycosyltransferase 85A1 isoform X2 [Cryptomeria japonica]XP_059065712.1 UDP-glycosyltransferase 85A1 isoform X2 [Cryptomeria japonica]
MMSPLHAVIVACPAQGHVNPLMNLAELLAMRGFFITFVTTEWMDQRLLKAASKDAAARDREIQGRGFKFRFLAIPDGLPPEHGRTSEIGELLLALQSLGPALESVLSVADESVPPITCIITDSYLSCTAEVAKNLGVPRVVFWTTCTAYAIILKNAHFLLSQGHIPVKEEDLKSKDKLITCLPGKIPPIRPTDIVSFFREKHVSEVIYSASLYESRIQNIADYVLVNTFEELEGGIDAQIGLSVNGCPSLAIGPVFLPNFLQGRNSVYSMWEEDKTCFQWLDGQAQGSVLYVSFGSMAIKSEKQLHELALGLEACGYPFLWVLRSDIADGKSLDLPEGFKDRTKDRALIVSWTNQLKVLSHLSIGGFLTHSGWNSTLEAISMGIPMIGWPYCGDQFLNCRFVKDVWNVGFDFKGVDVDEFKVVTQEIVESTIRSIMEGSSRVKLRENVVRLKEAAHKAVTEGGTSYSNLNTFAEDMQKIAKSRV